MRIVIDLQSAQNGSRFRGIGRYSLSLTQAMLRHGERHEFWVLLSDRWADAIPAVRLSLEGLIPQERIVVVELPRGPSGSFEQCTWRARAAESILEYFVAQLEPDIFFIPSLFEGFHDDTVTTVGRQSIRTAVTIHDLIPLIWPECLPSAGEKACYDRKLRFLKLADLHLPNSAFSGREAQQLLNISPDRSVVVYPAAKDIFQQLDLGVASINEIKSKFGISRPFVMFTSALDERKNVEGLIQAYSRIDVNIRLSHQLVIVGASGENTRSRLRGLAADSGLSDGELVFAGHVTDDELVRLYNLCKLFVMPSFHEGFGIPIVEAMACGAAVIGSNVTSIPEVIGRSDALFDPADLGSMAALMTQVLTDDAFHRSLCRHGLVQTRKFSYENSAKLALDAFEALAAEPRPTPLESLRAFGRRPRMAYVCRLPPEDGQAPECAAVLLRELSRYYDIELVLDQPRIDAPWLTANFPVRSIDWFERNGTRFERVVYHVAADARYRRTLDLLKTHPGVVVLHDFVLTNMFDGDADEARSRCLYEADGYGGLELGKVPNTACPANRQIMERAAGIVALSPAVIEQGRQRYGDALIRSWRQISDPLTTPCEASDALAAAIEDFNTSGPQVRRARLTQELSRDTLERPSEADLIDIAKCLVANSKPFGPSRLFLDVSDWLGAGPGHHLSGAIRGLILGLISEAGPRWRVEPVYRDLDGYNYARRFTGALLGSPEFALADEPIEPFVGDTFLSLEAGRASAAADLEPLRRLQLRGVKITFAVYDEHDVLSPAAVAKLARLLLHRAGAVMGARGTVQWLPSGSPKSAPLALPHDIDHGRLLGTMTRLWQAGVEADLLLLSRLGSLLDEVRSAVSQQPELLNRVIRWDDSRALSLENALFSAVDGIKHPTGPAGVAEDIHFAVAGHVRGTYSLAAINRMTARAMEHGLPGRSHLLPVEDCRPIADLDGVPREEYEEIRMLAARPLPAGDRRVVISQHYPLYVPEGRWDLKLSLFPWEESEVPRPTVHKLADEFDGVLATSRFTAKALIDSGLPIPVAAIGQPLDIAPFKTLERRGRGGRDPFVFLHISSTMERKGVDVLLAAWLRAFTRADNVRLIIKTFPNPHHDMPTTVAERLRDNPSCADIEVINRDADTDGLLELYRLADAMVLPSRGEGYNMPALEAMVAGVPLIVTGYGGQNDFCGPQEARLLNFRFARSKSHVKARNGLWIEPDEDDLVAALREFVSPEHQEAITTRAKNARSAALAAVDPQLWVRRLGAFTDHLLNTPRLPTPRIAWFSTWAVACGIAEHSRLLLDHLSPSTLERMVVLCDERTNPDTAPDHVRINRCWRMDVRGGPPGIAEQIERANPDAVVIQHQDGMISFLEAAELISDERVVNRTTVIVMHNAAHLPSAGDDLGAVLDGLRNASRVIVHSLEDVNLLRRYGLYENVTLLPPGADCASATPPIRDVADHQAAPVIGSTGFFLPGKGIDRLIRAAAQLRKTWPKLRLRLVNAIFPQGNSDQELATCRALAEELGMMDAIDWYLNYLPQEEIWRLLSDCDLVVLPYPERTDSVSGAVRLAMASQVPVLVTRVKMFSELDNGTDIVGWVESSEPDVLARGMAALLIDTDKRRKIQTDVRDWLTGFSWASAAKQLEGMVAGLVAAKRFERRDAEVIDQANLEHERGAERAAAE